MRHLLYLGSSLDNVASFPEDVQDAIKFALQTAVDGGKAPAAKPLKGLHGAGVLEVVERFDTDTYRAVYTVRFKHAVYVLHAFQKKSTQGRATSQRDMQMIERRLGLAERDAAERTKG